MIDLENLSNDLQESFENSDYIITSGGFFGDIACFMVRGKKNVYDIIISDEIIDFIPCEETEALLELFNLVEARNLVTLYFNQHDIKIEKSGIFVEEYQMQQISGFYFHIRKSSENIQIQIFPGDFAIPILLGQEPKIPKLSQAEFFGSFDESEINELLDQDAENLQERDRNYVPPKKAKKVGRNEPCPCGSGIKYKKCCGMMIK